jgi:hypothetical protein
MTRTNRGRRKLPDDIRLKENLNTPVTTKFKEKVEEVADKKRITTADLIRQATEEYIKANIKESEEV